MNLKKANKKMHLKALFQKKKYKNTKLMIFKSKIQKSQI